MKRYIAVDIGGTSIKYGIINREGKLMSLKSIPTPDINCADGVIKFLDELIASLWNHEISGIGISTLGVVDEERGMVVGACDNFPGLLGLGLKEKLKRRFRVSVSVMNDVNAAALGEAYFGAGKGLDTFYCITLGTGIGGAFIIQKKIHQGANGMAGEVGYLWKMPAEQGYEEKASMKAFLKASATDLDGIEVLQKVIDNDEKFLEYFNQWVQIVAQGIKDIIYILDPGTIIIGGGVSARGTFLTDRIQQVLEDIIVDEFKNKTKVLPATHSNMSNLLGAITPFLR